ncbi:MAG TPA: ACT domain-containing protein [Terriglobales bacterium]|nr:ACT domain-containing protein [Terriglobales bacterium]
MAKVKQLTIAVENRPGTLAQVAKTLADAKVNIAALLNGTAGAQGSVQVVVDNTNKAKKALDGAGLSYTEGTLEQVELANKPGALAELAGKLAKKGINIDSAYVTVPKGAKKAVVLLATSSVANRL